MTSSHSGRSGRTATSSAPSGARPRPWSIDPGADAAEIRLALAGSGATCAAILLTHSHFDHFGALADLAEGTGAPVWLPEGELDVSAGRTTSSPASRRVPSPATPTLCPAARRSRRRHLVPGPSRSGPLARPCLLLRGRCALLRRRALLRLGRPHRSALRRLGHAARVDPLPRRGYPPETVVYSVTARRRPSETSSPAIRSWPSSARDRRSNARGDTRHPSVRAAALAAGDGRDGAALRALRLPPDPDTRLRGHRALRAHVRRGLRHRSEGDVHLHRPLGPVADTAAGGDGADLSRLHRARPPPRAAAAEALHDRLDVPLRRAGARPLPRALAALGGGDRLRRSGDRRRDHPALRHAPAPARRQGLPAGAELDRLP